MSKPIKHANSTTGLKNRLGKCYIKLGLLRDAEKHFRSSLKVQPTVSTYLELSNVYIRLDMPNSSMDLLEEASSKFTTDPHILLGIARLNDQLNHQDAALKIYRQVLSLDASNIESLASLGAHYFYSDQPESFHQILSSSIADGREE